MGNVCIYNEKMLDVAIQQIYKDFESMGEMNLVWEKKYKDKTIKQNAFFWGALVNSVQDYFYSKGIEYKPEDIKNNFYSAISYMDERFRRKVRRFNGEEYEVPLRISEMDIETMGRFIDRAIWLIENAPTFNGLVLHPSIKNTWVRHITTEDIKSVNRNNFSKRDNEYLAYLRKQSCLICGAYNNNDAHHIRIYNEGGTAIKPPDYFCCSLCRDCHRMAHIKGLSWVKNNLKWITKYIDIDNFLLIQYNRWKNHL